MTEIAFHVNLADPIAYACRLLRKASGGGAQVVVVGDPAQLRALDQSLWTFSPTDFIAHCVAGVAPASVLARSPIVLAPDERSAPQRQVLINLTDETPQGFSEFQRLIELVAADPETMQRGRVRWKQYGERGYSRTLFDQKDVAP